MITTEENVVNRDNVIANWHLGPEKTVGDNLEYWATMAAIWSTTLVEARAMLCANCEYFNNTKDTLLELNAIPQDIFDADGGGRGLCERFDFICHNLRTCQAWEDESIIDDMGEEALKSVIADAIKGYNDFE